MTRIRSPNYPALSLPEAIEKLKLVHKHEQHLAAPREVVARHMGYSSLNGSSLKALSALLKYGLLEKTKDDKRKVASLGLKILHPRDDAERIEAIRQAAAKPSLFVEFAAEWPDGTPSDGNMKSYLIHRNFAADAIPEVIKAYRETVKLVTSESEGYDSAHSAPQGEQEQEAPVLQSTHEPQRGHQRPTQAPVPVPRQVDGEPYRLSLTPSGIEISGYVTDQATADKLIGALSALKVLLSSRKTSDQLEDDEVNQE